MTARCPDCDLPLATHADWHGTPEGEGDHMCWRAWSGDICCRTPMDWRERALAAEARAAEFEVRLHDIELAAFTVTRRKPTPTRLAPVHYAAIGTDGARPVVWGLGSDASGATWDAYDQDDSDGWEMQGTAVVRVSRQVAKRIRAGEVSCETLGIAVEIRDGRIVGAASPSSGPPPRDRQVAPAPDPGPARRRRARRGDLRRRGSAGPGRGHHAERLAAPAWGGSGEAGGGAVMRTRFGLVVEVASPPDREGYVETIAVCTGRPYARLHASGLRPAAPHEVDQALVAITPRRASA